MVEKIKKMESSYSELLELYDKLESLFKASQLVQQIFEKQVLNEFRYFSRAIVDYNKAKVKMESLSNQAQIEENVDFMESALIKARLAVSSAYNDILDSLIHNIKATVSELKRDFWNSNLKQNLKSLEYGEVLRALRKADTVVISSRESRDDRLQQYIDFANSDEYKRILDFSLRLRELEYLCEIDGKPYSKRKKETIAQAKKALSNKENCESLPRFSLFLQPKIELNEHGDPKLIGAEALIRLNARVLDNSDNKTHKNVLLGPDQFLDLAFKAGLEFEITNWVVKEASKIAKSWIGRQWINKSFSLAINVPPNLTANGLFIDQFSKTVKEENVQTVIAIEITENWESNSEHARLTSYNLKQLNKDTKISIDDFGSGSTKIDYLSKFDGISCIKIDKSLVDGLDTKGGDKTKKLIGGIVALAEQNGFEVIAEGVENDYQVKHLTDIKVRRFQGYLYSRPLSLSDFQSLYFCNTDN